MLFLLHTKACKNGANRVYCSLHINYRETDMLYVKHRTMMICSGALWMAIGVALLNKGLHLLSEMMVSAPGALPLAGWISLYLQDPEGIKVLLIAVALALGMFKGRVVMAKVVMRVVTRIATLPNPAPLFRLFGKGYLVLLIGGVMMGWLVNHLGLSHDIRGVIDVAVGAALISGGSRYFRFAAA